MKHTPAPWLLKKNFFTNDYLNISAGEYGNIGTVNTIENFERGTIRSEFEKLGVTKEMCEANAQLMAAAPDLLKALKEAHGFLVCAEEIFRQNKIDYPPITDRSIKTHWRWSIELGLALAGEPNENTT